MGTAKVEASAQVSLLGKKDAHPGSYICPPSFQREVNWEICYVKLEFFFFFLNDNFPFLN